MKRIVGMVLGVLAGTALLVGCVNGYPEDPGEAGEARPAPEWDDWDDDYSEQQIAVSNGYLAGDMGDARGFDGPATRHEGYGDGSWASMNVYLTDRAAGYSAMMIVEVDGDLAGLEPGTHLEDGRGDGVEIHLTGCSGRREGAWDWDAPPNDFVVDIDEGSAPGTLRFDFVANFSRDQTTEGSFDVAVQ